MLDARILRGRTSPDDVQMAANLQPRAKTNKSYCKVKPRCLSSATFGCLKRVVAPVP